MKLHEIILAITATCSALISGLFFAYTFSVNLGLHKLDDKSYLMAMQNINREILNPVFYSCFLGAPLLLIVSSVLYFDLSSPKFYLILTACLSYIIGVLMITGTKNVPLNNQLDSFDISTASSDAIYRIRLLIEDPWVFWNNIRTVFSFITLVCLIMSLIFFRSKN
ncbi:anthrone oxygenase family protein [Sphingobacterium sp. DR205]|uniref:anthrone oxygenase family protein n=1 Tax=Sphingobacterium sp. DR205 TaxID=2713573 RepID=UPI0013E44E55|nr:anthrone oxygenase family protein [Sphingobacterium sp. DR205]QIH35675.1 DUF1772 domain-containing protein [Sphingobacterium sp. DR205]